MKPLNTLLAIALLHISLPALAQVSPVTIIDPMENITHILGSAQMDGDPAEEIVILQEFDDRLMIIDSSSGLVEFDSDPYGWTAIHAPAYNRQNTSDNFSGHNYGTDIFVDEDGDGEFCAMIMISQASIYEQQLAIICLVGQPTAISNPDVPYQGSNLDQNHPNPFNPVTQIDFYIAAAGKTVMKIFDVRGQLVRTLMNEPLPAGNHSVVWDGSDDAGRGVASGAYFYQLETNGRIMTKKSLLVK